MDRLFTMSTKRPARSCDADVMLKQDACLTSIHPGGRSSFRSPISERVGHDGYTQNTRQT